MPKTLPKTLHKRWLPFLSLDLHFQGMRSCHALPRFALMMREKEKLVTHWINMHMNSSSSQIKPRCLCGAGDISGDSAPCWHESWLCQLHINAESLSFHHIPKVHHFTKIKKTWWDWFHFSPNLASPLFRSTPFCGNSRRLFWWKSRSEEFRLNSYWSSWPCAHKITCFSADFVSVLTVKLLKMATVCLWRIRLADNLRTSLKCFYI